MPESRTGRSHFSRRISQVVTCLSGLWLTASVSAQDDARPELIDEWKRNGLATVRFEINGTGSRNNPLRRQLKRPFSGDEIYFRYSLRYDEGSIDTPTAGDGEFFVFWLDDQEGNDASTHSGGIPNIGIHVDGGRNRFMARYSLGSQRFAAQLVGDREYIIVGRLWKSTPGAEEPFDGIDLWVDSLGRADKFDRDQPHARTQSPKAISGVSWIGFSTGVKTESDDRITVWDVDLSTSWRKTLRFSNPKVPTRFAQRTVDFKQHVFPILKAHCFDCHAGDDAEKNIRLDSLDEVLNRTTPRNADKSPLYQLAAAGKMPANGERLSGEKLAVLRTWINEGLDWDEELLPTPVPQTNHWAFQKIERPSIPAVKDDSWVRTPVDAFIARRHEEFGLRPAAPADVQTLDRRVCLDLLGLPPAATDIDRPSSHISELLSHTAYGERWGRHWLDVARWAESNGHQHNRDRKHAWRYRDWVIDAFHSNKPYDEFVREQVAGDEMSPVQDSNLTATGFLAAARYSGNELDKDIQRNDILTDVTNATASAILGLTMECAQCHTHKFDPVSIRDYYRFQAFFSKGQPANLLMNPGSADVKSIIEERWQIFDTVRAKLISSKRRQGIANPVVIPKSVLAAIRGDQRKRFNQLDEQIKTLSQSWGWQSATSSYPDAVAPHDMRFPLPRDPNALAANETYLLIRGDVKSPGPVVEPGWPTVFGKSSGRSATAADRPRTALADWLTSPDNPLTARVWVNRIWQWHFGRGLVETSSDFGAQGTRPSHPELLDWLASELIDNQWNTNHIHHAIVNSATYRQSLEYSAANAKLDPENKNYWRWTPRRLEAEAIRDSILAVSDQLDLTHGGRSVSSDSTRRSIYLKQRRHGLPHQQKLFDSADGNLSCARRRVSTTALQPLWLLNSDFMHRSAQQFAARSESVEHAFELALNRKPDREETSILHQLERDHGMASACLVILNSSEFVYIR